MSTWLQTAIMYVIKRLHFCCLIMLLWFSSVLLVFWRTQQGFRQPHSIMFLSDLRGEMEFGACTLSKLLCPHTEMPDCSWLGNDSRHLSHSLLFFFSPLALNLTWNIFAFLIAMMISLALHCSSRFCSCTITFTWSLQALDVSQILKECLYKRVNRNLLGTGDWFFFLPAEKWHKEMVVQWCFGKIVPAWFSSTRPC